LETLNSGPVGPHAAGIGFWPNAHAEASRAMTIVYM
jgi:hypothetical protein